MKFATVFAVFATLAAAVSAVDLAGITNAINNVDATGLTNAKRLAKGFPLKPPVRHRPTPTHGPPKGHPSGISNSCNTGPVQCCNSVTSANKEVRDQVKSLVGLVVAPGVAIGLTCSPISFLRGKVCSQQPVCCENNSFKGLVAIGCSPINLV